MRTDPAGALAERETASPALEARGATKRFGDRIALDDVSLRLPAGRVLGLLGPNGAGKTTAVRLFTGLVAPTSGTVELFGETLGPRSADRLRARTGVQTDTDVYAGLTVLENLRTWGELYGIPPRELAGRIDDLLAVLALEDRADSRAGELSKGMRQKLAVGRAVLHRPDLLFLDEPTAGLDPEASEDLIDYIRRETGARRMTVVICTHRLEGLESLCDDVGILDSGRLAVAGPVDDLLTERFPRRRHLLDVDDPERAAAGIRALVGHAPVRRDRMLEVSLDPSTPIERIVAGLVADGIGIRAVVPCEPTIRDLYFATIREGRQRP